MSIDGIRAVDKEPLAAFDYLFGMSIANGQRVGPRPVGAQDVAVQIGSALPLGAVKAYPSVAAMNADTAPAAGTLAYAEGKTYRKTAASGSAGWEVFLDFIPGAQLINAPVTGGTANAVLATSASPVSGVAYKQLIAVGPFTAANTGAMTISINGETARPLVTNTGDPIPANYIRPKMSALVVIDADGKYRLFSYGDAAAVQAAAEAAKLAAEAARDATLAALASVTAPRATRALAIADNPGASPDPEYYDVAYYDTNYEPASGTRYRKRASNPGSPDAFRNRGGTGSWYSIDTGVVNPAMFGARSGSSSDQRAALQAALDFGGATIDLLGKRWRCDGDLTRNTDVTIFGGIIDFSSGGGLGFIGSLTALADLSVNVAKGDRALTWAALPAIAAGDVVIVYNPTNYSWGSRRDYYRDGAMFRVHSTSGNNARLYGQAVDAYVAADMDVYKINPVRVRLVNVHVIPSSSAEKAPIKISMGVDCSVHGLSGFGGLYTMLELDRCFNTDVSPVFVGNNSPVVGDEYGILVSNCHHTSIRGGGAFATRHAVALGGSSGPGCVPTRYTTISDMTLFNYAIDAGSADAHGNCDFTRYVNCNLLSGASIGGRNVELSGCEIFEWPADATGSCFWVSECVGGTYKFVNCTLRSNGDGQTSSAYLYINPQGPGNGTNRPVETKMRDDLTVIIDGLTIITPNAGSLAKAVRIQGQNANKKINVAVVGAGIIWKAPQGLCFVMVTDDTLATVPTDHIIVDSVTGPNGAELLRPDAGVANANVRMMPQMASATVSCSSGTNQAASASVAFRYKFPRLPQVLGVSHRSTDGLAKVAWGGKQVTSAVYALTANDARLVALTSDLANFTSTEDIRLSGLFGIQNV